MYKRVLLAYDGSLEGARALMEGALVAKACCAEVVLLSVAPETAGVQIAEGIQGGVVAQLIESHKTLLQQALTRLKALGFKVVGRLEVGEPAPTIGKVAKETGAELVVVGHHKQTFLSRWWSGDTDAYLSDHVHCSVLLSRCSMSDEEFETRAHAASASADATP
jgi:nucleotide-binding universal stress UspA family protein